jgi:hypothetical protein
MALRVICLQAGEDFPVFLNALHCRGQRVAIDVGLDGAPDDAAQPGSWNGIDLD